MVQGREVLRYHHYVLSWGDVVAVDWKRLTHS